MGLFLSFDWLCRCNILIILAQNRSQKKDFHWKIPKKYFPITYVGQFTTTNFTKDHHYKWSVRVLSAGPTFQIIEGVQCHEAGGVAIEKKKCYWLRTPNLITTKGEEKPRTTGTSLYWFFPPQKRKKENFFCLHIQCGNHTSQKSLTMKNYNLVDENSQ